MHISRTLVTVVLSFALAACSGVETRPEDTAGFAAKNYQYYSWRSQPLQNPANSTDAIYLMDPIVRREIDKTLQAKGYRLDPERAQFSVDYLQAPGLRMGEKSEVASNITHYPTVNPNRQVDGAVVDNAHALGGVKETNNIAIQINDVAGKQEIWQVIITKFVENVNQVDRQNLDKNLSRAISKGLDTLPPASN
jgi:hypothetical protein